MQKQNLKIIWFIFLILGIFSFVKKSQAATLYMPDDCANLRSCATVMNSGDDLIIRDGTYSGENNYYWQWAMPPSGTSNDFTSIKAEHDGEVIFSNGFLKMSGGGIASAYVSFEGLKSLDETILFGINHIKFLRCAFTYNNTDGQSASAPFWIGNGCSYILVEDCWAWGAGRYKFVTGGDHNVFRRCVARYDRTDWTDPMGNFCSYAGNYIAFQNCIAIDSDHEEFWLNTGEIGGNFYIHHGATHNTVEGSIGINNHNPWITGAPGPGLEIKNNLGLDIDNVGFSMRGDNYSAGEYDIENCSLINVSGHGLDPWFGEANSVSALNNVLFGIGGTALHGNNLGGTNTGYNSLFNNVTDYSGNFPVATDYCSENANAIDPLDGTPGNGTPAILYPVRVEQNSNLFGTGQGGTNRGANITKRIGVAGTFYGDEGYRTVTEDDLWPWPNEDRLKSDLAAYSYTGLTTLGSTSTLSGTRGFAATGKQLNGTDDITLTSYIWEYLGNQIPAEIYGDDEIAPVSPTGLGVI